MSSPAQKSAKKITAKTASSEVTTTVIDASKTSATAKQTINLVSPEEDTRFLKKHLLENVSRRTGVRKNEIRPIVDAVLAELGEALAEDAELVLQPLGKLMVKRVKDVSNATVYTCRIRHSTSQPDVAVALNPEEEF